MSLKEWITILFGSGVLVTAWGYLYGRIKKVNSKNEAIALGVQALLRDRLVALYNHYMEREYAPIYAKQNFENIWKQYHNLGVNGVMDSLREDFMKLPTEKKGDFENEECKD